MTKEITKARIIQEIEDKFKLRELVPEPFAFSETVVPVYDVKPHLQQVSRRTLDVSVTSSGAVLADRVPAAELWSLHRYNVIFVSGSFTLAGIFAGRPNAAEYVYLDLTAAQSTSYAIDLPKDVTLRPGDGIYANVDGYTSSGTLTLILDVTRESVR